MNHKPFVDRMHAALDGELFPTERDELTAHLTACTDCQTTWDALIETQRLLKAEPLAAPRAGFTGRFRARLQAQRSRPRVVWGALVLGFGAVSAAAIILPLGFGLLFSGWHFASQATANAALYNSLTTIAALVAVILQALLTLLSALAELVLAHPLTGPATASALTIVLLWLYLLRKLTPEAVLR